METAMNHHLPIAIPTIIQAATHNVRYFSNKPMPLFFAISLITDYIFIKYQKFFLNLIAYLTKL